MCVKIGACDTDSLCRTTTGQLGIWDLASKRQIWTNEGKDQILSIHTLHDSSKLLRYIYTYNLTILDQTDILT